ncbi:hypothetical protein RQP46_004861 [Phenoliferia psychrophenolica]
MAAAGVVDILFGDYLAEINVATKALEMVQNPELGFENVFLYQLERSIDDVVKNKLKIICNAGALNVKGLAKATEEIVRRHGHSLRIAYVTGDDLLSQFNDLKARGETFQHLEGGGKSIEGWSHTPVSVNAYIGAEGIIEALCGGADIILTGRVTDASPVIAASAWWHGWEMSEYDKIAGALLAGHCIECGAYVTGGNFCGFKAIPEAKAFDLAFPIAEVAHDGTFVVTKHEGTNGLVSIDTVRCQILYEIQGNVYLNPDVQGILNHMKVEQVGVDRVKVSGVTGRPPPSTTKAAICAIAGYQAEFMMFATGIDVEEKFKYFQAQVEKGVGPEVVSQFTTWSFVQYGVPERDPSTQARATACLRVFCQAPTIEAFGPHRNLRALLLTEGLGHYAGMHFPMDGRSARPLPYIEYYPARVAVDLIQVETHYLGSSEVTKIPKSTLTIPYIHQDDYDSTVTYKVGSDGPTVRAPLGSIVFGRSGDKGGNANVGLFVRHQDEYNWLCALMSKATMVQMLGNEVYTSISRCEFPTILAVHFVVRDILGFGVSSTDRFDCLAKSVAEFIRFKEVDIPVKFMQRGLV